MDALAITAIISGLSGLAIAIFSHVKHSECSRCFVIDTRTPTLQSPPQKHLVIKEPQSPQGGFGYAESISEDEINRGAGFGSAEIKEDTI